MIKNFLTAIGMLTSSISFSQEATEVLEMQDPVIVAQLNADVAEACGNLSLESDDYNQCVQIVSMNFTIIPHNTSAGGVGHDPISSTKSAAE